MKVLILSCSTGGGHNAAANAIAERLTLAGHSAEVLDFLHLINEKLDRLTCSSYLFCACRAPFLFGMTYHLGLAVSKTFYFKPSAVQRLYSRHAEKLGDYIAQNGFDAVLFTHVFAGEALTALKRKGYDIPLTVSVSTDYTCMPFLEEVSADYFVIPHEDLIPEFSRRGVPEDRLLPYGIPVSVKYLSLPDKRETKRALGFPADLPLYLIMGGSMGAGHVTGFVKRLVKKIGEGRVAVICGTNDTLRAKLEKAYPGGEKVRAVGFTDRVCDYMAACDVLYTKPGGLSSTEALVAGAPIVHTSPIPGCEPANVRFFRAHGLSIPAKHAKKQIRVGMALAEDQALRSTMKDAQKRAAKPDCTAEILHLLERELSPSAENAQPTGV